MVLIIPSYIAALPHHFTGIPRNEKENPLNSQHKQFSDLYSGGSWTIEFATGWGQGAVSGIEDEMYVRKQKTLCWLKLHPKGFPGGSDGEESACNAGD